MNEELKKEICLYRKTKYRLIHTNAYASGFNSAKVTDIYIDSSARNRGVKVENFTVIYKVGMPSILVEYGFYTNLEDLCVLRCYREELVKATLRGINKYFDLG